ncbi:bifunctional phosphoribosyl-AMP cyclohydrolase/phosphoribosyl-ATP diphosphatase HisIE [Lentibacillus halophilus]|uniref:Histidine biosynthesis bifunctional protein HisIE n=1 Tax=Lentibacillus halophilus TaxID=295065 RepID=A0ABP3IX41_9BACI
MYDEQLNSLTFDEYGLIPAIVQDAETGSILTHAYMNKESLEKTLQTGETWFYSRQRQKLWHKGEESGNTQQVKEITSDCDQDALLVKVQPVGPACHTGEASCFHHVLQNSNAAEQMTLSELANLIKKRRAETEEGSYTTYLFSEGIDKILKKVGEETSEVIIGAKNNSRDEMVWEIADLSYHTLVLMELMDVSISEIREELAKRHSEKEGSQHA